MPLKSLLVLQTEKKAYSSSKVVFNLVFDLYKVKLTL